MDDLVTLRKAADDESNDVLKLEHLSVYATALEETLVKRSLAKANGPLDKAIIKAVTTAQDLNRAIDTIARSGQGQTAWSDTNRAAVVTLRDYIRDTASKLDNFVGNSRKADGSADLAKQHMGEDSTSYKNRTEVPKWLGKLDSKTAALEEVVANMPNEWGMALGRTGVVQVQDNLDRLEDVQTTLKRIIGD